MKPESYLLLRWEALHASQQNMWSGWLLYRFCRLWGYELLIDEHQIHANNCHQCNEHIRGKNHLCFSNDTSEGYRQRGGAEEWGLCLSCGGKGHLDGECLPDELSHIEDYENEGWYLE